MIMSNDGSTPTTVLDVSAGVRIDSTFSTLITNSAFTKSIAGAWIAGSGGHGMGNGLTATLSTWYHVFAIINGGVADVYFDTSITAANKPAGTTAFVRIGSIYLDASTHIVSFTQIGNRFMWTLPYADLSGASGATGSASVTLHTPPGLSTNALIHAFSDYVSQGADVLFYNLTGGVQVCNVPAGNFSLAV